MVDLSYYLYSLHSFQYIFYISSRKKRSEHFEIKLVSPRNGGDRWRRLAKEGIKGQLFDNEIGLAGRLVIIVDSIVIIVLVLVYEERWQGGKCYQQPPTRRWRCGRC